MSTTPDPAAASSGDVPPFRYTAALAERIELGWQDRWETEGTFNAPNPTGELAEGFDRVAIRPHAFVMDMFPYPSGDGLHVGHPLGYIGTDAFGLPAEQYAVQTGQHPATTTNRNIEVFSRQLRRMGLGHDRRRSVSTTDVEFYRWTQWIFTRIFGSWYDTEADRARPIETLVEERDAGLAGSMYEAVLRQILTDPPERPESGPMASAVAFRAVAPELAMLSGGERKLLTEWLDRVVDTLARDQAPGRKHGDMRPSRAGGPHHGGSGSAGVEAFR